jgi:hypothetical protein
MSRDNVLPSATLAVSPHRAFAELSEVTRRPKFSFELGRSDEPRFREYLITALETFVSKYMAILGFDPKGFRDPFSDRYDTPDVRARYLLLDSTRPLELTYTVAPSVENQQLLLDRERLKTELMAERRALLLERRRSEELTSENDKLWDCMSDIVKENQALIAMVIAQKHEKVCFHERHEGEVVERKGDQKVIVSYRSASGESIRQTYDKAQFSRRGLPEVGDRIQAYVMVATDRPPDAHAATDSELRKAFRGFSRGKTGKVVL